MHYKEYVTEEDIEAYHSQYSTNNETLLILYGIGLHVASDGSHKTGDCIVVNHDFVGAVNYDNSLKGYKIPILQDCKVKMYYSTGGSASYKAQYSGTGGVFGNGSIIDASAGDYFLLDTIWSSTQGYAGAQLFALVLLEQS